MAFASDTVGDSAHGIVAGLGDGDVALLENLRFNPGETSKDDAERGAFADQLAELADAFVSDGFGVVHRKQASVYDVAQRLPHAAGGLVLAEVQVLRRLTQDPERPYAVVLGGAKVSDKLAVIDNLIGTADRLLIGGGMAFTFLAAQGLEVGQSLLETDQIDTVKGYLERARTGDVEIVLPTDVVAATAFSADADHEVVAADAIPADRMGLDIGPQSAALFAAALADAKTVFWNGPDGRVRDGAVRRRHSGARAGPHRGQRADRRRRRRLGRGRPHVGLCRQRLRAHLDRGRREPGVPGRQDPARPVRPGGLNT